MTTTPSPDNTGTLGSVYILGTKLKQNLTEACISAEMELSVDQVSQLTMTFLDAGFKILRSGLFALGNIVRYKDLTFIVASVDTDSLASNEQIVIKCRPKTVNDLKKRRGTKILKGASPSDFVRAECKAVGAKYYIQPSAKRKQVARDKPKAKEKYGPDDTPSSWTTFQRLAGELGFALFEMAGVIYFGRPTYFLNKFKETASLVTWNLSYSKYWAETVPKCTKSLDSKETTVTVTLPLERVREFRPGRTMRLAGVPTFDGYYLIDNVNFDLAGESARLQVTASTAIDPEKQGTSSSSSSSSSKSKSKSSAAKKITSKKKSSSKSTKYKAGSSNTKKASDFVNWAKSRAGGTYVFGATRSTSNRNLMTFDCLRRGTLVHTTQGAVPIEGVAVGDMVYTMNPGTGMRGIQPVVTKFVPEIKDVWRLRTRNRTIEASDNHPVMVMRKQPRTRNTNGTFRPVVWDRYWTPLKEVKRGDYIVTVKHVDDSIENLTLDNGRVIDEDLSWFFGQFVGDGSYRKNGVNLCAFKVADRERILATAKRVWGVDGVKHDSHGLYWSSKKMCDDLLSLGFENVRAPEKTIPVWVWQLNESCKQAFLDGYGTADGSRSDKGFSFHSASKQLAHGSRMLHIHLGHRVTNVSVNKRVHPITINGKLVKKAKPLYSYVWYPTKPGVRHNNGQLALDHLGIGNSIADPTFTVQKVLECGPTGETDEMYDIEVANDHCFFAEGVLVKNCSSLVRWAMARVGINFPGNTVTQASYLRRGHGIKVSLETAYKKRGALLYRLHGGGRNDHVAISLGNGKTIEAMGRSYGVRYGRARGRGWTDAWVVRRLR
jgi:cell wall-associated NlpC family hydrolase